MEKNKIIEFSKKERIINELISGMNNLLDIKYPDIVKNPDSMSRNMLDKMNEKELDKVYNEAKEIGILS